MLQNIHCSLHSLDFLVRTAPVRLWRTAGCIDPPAVKEKPHWKAQQAARAAWFASKLHLRCAKAFGSGHILVIFAIWSQQPLLRLTNIPSMADIRLYALLFVCLCFVQHPFTANAQQIGVCPGGSFNPYAIFSSQLSACGAGAQLNIVSSTVNGVSTGTAPLTAMPSSAGILNLQVLDADNEVCETVSLNVFIADAGFTANPIVGGCNALGFEAVNSIPGCTHTYNIMGTNYAGPDVDFSFPNAGPYQVVHTVQCGSCTISESQEVTAPGVQAALNLSSSSSLFFDGNFQSLVLCSSTGDYALVINDASNAAAGATYDLQITLPDGSVQSSNSIPAPYTLTTSQSGTVAISYTITQNGCASSQSYSIFFATNFGTTQLDVPIDIGTLQCAEDDFSVTVCPGGCPNNPPGTLYRVVLDCNNFQFETTTVPFTVDIPLNIGSCGSTCSAGGFQSLCACELVIVATRPCVAPASAAFCPFRIQPQPNALFELIPPDPDNTYCQGELVTFAPEWEEIDCDPFNPTPSICEIQNQAWTISPDTGWTNFSSNLESFPLNIRFDVPGEYSICFDWANSCGSAVHCETVCILDNTPPSIDWLGAQVYCLGEQLNPSVSISQPACASTSVEWQSMNLGVNIDNDDDLSPTLSFSQVGNAEVKIEIEGLCGPFQESFTYTVCDAPLIALSQMEVVLCVGQEFCLGSLVQVNWNNCVGDLLWTIPGEQGSPFLNPLAGETCTARDGPESFTVLLEASNDCGSDGVAINVVVEESPACALLPPPPFCTGGTVNIALPTGSSAPLWYSSPDGVNFSPLPAGMPQSPTATTYYYVESSVNGCFCISDTVVAVLIPEPIFDVITSASAPCPGNEVFFVTGPDQGVVNWLDGAGNILATTDTLVVTATEPLFLTAQVVYGQDGVSCNTSASGGIVPEVNPLTLDCAGLPSLLCDGDAPIALPAFGPAGGTVSIGTPGNVLQSNPTEIDPTLLGTGNFFFYYTLDNQGAESCTFRDSCAFSISAPAAAVITPAVDSLCFGQSIVFEETSGLAGTWSSACPDAIDPLSGLFDPEAANCPPGSPTEIYYGGNCILDFSIEVYLIDVPEITITASTTTPCPGDEVTLNTSPTGAALAWSSTGGIPLGSEPSLNLVVTEPVVIFAEAEFGSASTSCTSSASLAINPETNPVIIDCGAFPANFCAGNAPIPLPSASPPGGVYRIDNSEGTVQSAPDMIDPGALGPGAFELVYQIDNFGAEGCTFSTGCTFTVLLPQTPEIAPQPGSICYNTPVAFGELTGLNGSWAADCSGAIDPLTGFFDPAAAGCPANEEIAITYSGNCILDTTFVIFVHAVPEVSIQIPETMVCENGCTVLGAAIAGSFEAALWNLSWLGGDAQLAPGDNFCPAEWGIQGSTDVAAVLEVSTNSQPVCTVLAEVGLQVLGIPDEAFNLASPQCIEGGIALPPCGECTAYQISFTDNANNAFNCTAPGPGCFAPDTGLYLGSVVFDYGFCQSNPREVTLTVADSPFLEILSQTYEPCAPVVNYEVLYGGFQTNTLWNSPGSLLSSIPAGNNVYNVLINHSGAVQVDTLYTDVVTVSNFCGSKTASASVFHQAPPNFTIDPDEAYYCSNVEFNIEIGFPQPLQLDSLTLDYAAAGEGDALTLYDFPEADFAYSFEAVNDTLPVVFTATAANACAVIAKQVTVYIMPRDVAADVDVFYENPLCPGDTIPLVFNSVGNINLDQRSVTSNSADLKVVQLLGNWYLIPQAGLEDGTYTVTLTEFGFCGIDVATEQVSTGPSLSIAFDAEDVCLGQSTTFVPLVGPEANLLWEFEPETFSTAQQATSFRYALPGLYFPSLTAVNPNYCDGFYSAPVEVFTPEMPQIGCDVGCTGFLNECSIDFNDGVICISVENRDAMLGYEWRVRGQFIPEYGSSIRIPVDQLRACEDNVVQVRVVDNNGCREVGRRNIAFNDGLIHIPNAFTPNADGFNDFWRPVILGAPFDYHLSITDRWGRTIWETNDHTAVWRGEDAGAEHHVGVGVYNYILLWKPCNRAEDKMKVLTGHITVVR